MTLEMTSPNCRTQTELSSLERSLKTSELAPTSETGPFCRTLLGKDGRNPHAHRILFFFCSTICGFFCKPMVGDSDMSETGALKRG